MSLWLLLLIVPFLAPCHLAFLGWARSTADYEGVIRFGLVFGLIPFSFHLPADKKAKKPKKLKPSPSKKVSWFKWLRFVWKRRSLWVGELRAFFRLFYFKKGSGDITYGFEDPALTGQTFGVAQVLLGSSHLDLKPDFFEKKLAGAFELRFFFIPIMMMVGVGVSICKIVWQMYRDQLIFVRRFS